MINVSTFAGCFALRLRSTAAVPLFTSPSHPAEVRRLRPDKEIHAISRPPVAGPLDRPGGLGILLIAAAPSAAQGFGVGAEWRGSRPTPMSTSSTTIPYGSPEGQIRLGLSQRMGVEVSLDRHSESFELLNQKRKGNTHPGLAAPQAGKRQFSAIPPGRSWLVQAERFDQSRDRPTTSSVSTTEFGWHAGGGLELRVGRHVGIHGDYRYTFLDFSTTTMRKSAAALWIQAGCFRATKARCGRWARRSISRQEQCLSPRICPHLVSARRASPPARSRSAASRLARPPGALSCCMLSPFSANRRTDDSFISPARGPWARCRARSGGGPRQENPVHRHQAEERVARDHLGGSLGAGLCGRGQLQRRLARRAQGPHRLCAPLRAHDVQGVRQRRARRTHRTWSSPTVAR